MKVPQCMREVMIKFDCQNRNDVIFASVGPDRSYLSAFIELRFPMPDDSADVEIMDCEIRAFFEEITRVT